MVWFWVIYNYRGLRKKGIKLKPAFYYYALTLNQTKPAELKRTYTTEEKVEKVTTLATRKRGTNISKA
jgi:hypothetical protein